MLVETLAFLNEDKLIMISKDPLYRVYIFTKEDNKFIHQSTIKVESYDEKIFLSNGRLFIYDENLGSITKWDINTLKFEAYFLFDNSFEVDNMKLDDNGVLLFVYGRKRVDNLHKDPYPCISVYSADHGNKFTTYKYHDKTVIIDAVYLIASDIGARLLIVHHNTIDEETYQYHICDPFAPYIPGESFVEANDLFKEFEANGDDIFENKYIIKCDKIVGFINDKTLIIKELIPVNWISYLRDTLKDSNSIFISSVSENIVDLIFKSKEIADKAITDIDKKMSKKATKVIESEKTIEEATTDIDKSKETTEKATTDVYREYQKKYFVTWTLKYENMKIFLTAKFKNDKIEQAKTKSDSIQIVPELYISSDRDVKEFVNICDCLDNDDLVMVTYWEDIIKEDEDTLLRKLFNGCIEQIEKDEEILNTQIFKIFSQSITEISKKNPSFFEYFVIKISLLCVLNVKKEDQTLKHLNHYQSYSCLSELTYLESLFDTIYNSFLYKKFTPSNLYIYIINSYPYKKIISKFKPCRTPQLFLMFPLPNFITYYENDEDDDSCFKKLFKPRSSYFINIDDLIFYKTWNGEALINFKWNNFGRKYYFAIWMIYIVFFGSFSIVATLSAFIP
ncbi:transient receptor potential cation channel subfamily a member 1 [Gigaspora margarita]|uniref:Transient receptor potential cation channel subfamily a member 1 n=1 Tax=Gigaspora margarita TaxID=4874 RepID=A0A8H3X617_GIGMA|nr:transient receptor potential cation channel subfamily a member 1 [Gigaspora margarita]